MPLRLNNCERGKSGSFTLEGTSDAFLSSRAKAPTTFENQELLGSLTERLVISIYLLFKIGLLSLKL
jgi:hypothetical protein